VEWKKDLAIMPPEGLLCLGMPLLFLLTLPVAGVLERWRLRRGRSAFLRGRDAGMTDEQFLGTALAGAESDLAPFYLAGRQTMAGLCGVPAETVYPDDTVRALLNLQFDNGYIDDFVFALEEKVGGALPQGYPPDNWTFAAYLGELGRYWQCSGRIVLRLDPRRLANPSWALRRVLPEVLGERSGGSIQYDGHTATADGTALLLHLRADQLDEAVACIVEVVEQVPVLDNDLRPAVVAAVRRPGGYEVVYPRDFVGPFPS
jgi:hypothetical protein